MPSSRKGTAFSEVAFGSCGSDFADDLGNTESQIIKGCGYQEEHP